MIKRYLSKRNNPWELLVIAMLFLLPAIPLLFQSHSFLFPSFGSRIAQITLWSPTELHVLGWFGVVIAAILFALYFYARRIIGREEKSPPTHFVQL
jgi:H+/gluconate symporter-like permease